MKGSKVYTAVALSVTAVVAVESAASGSGYPNSTIFQNYVDLIGPCGGAGSTKTNLVRGLQAMLWASGSYGTPGAGGNKSQVDGAWGSQTSTALTTYQYYNGLTVDGCAGWNTTTDMRNDWSRQMPDLTTASGAKAQRYYYDHGNRGCPARRGTWVRRPSAVRVADDPWSGCWPANVDGPDWSWSGPSTCVDSQ